MTATLMVLALLLPSELRNALEKYDFGDFEVACAKLDELRFNNAFDMEARVVTLKYLGACRHVQGDPTGATAAFESLLSLDANAQLDPVQFPPDMVQFFAGVKGKFQSQPEPEPEPKPDQETLDDLRASDSHPPRKSAGVALLPFGAGQFQNGQSGKGVTFATGQAVSFGIGVISLLLFEAEKTSGTFLGGGEFEDPDKAALLQTVELVAFSSFAGLWAWSVIDAFANFDGGVALVPTGDGLTLLGTF